MKTPDQLINLSILPFLRSLISMPRDQRQRFCTALMECSDRLQGNVFKMMAIAEDASLPVAERQRALMTIADDLCLRPNEEGRHAVDLVASENVVAYEFPALAGQVEKTDSQEAEFADRLREMMQSKCVTQKQLADRIGCSQPAISQMLNRKCRPQRKTLEIIAEALAVDVRELWPDIAVADMLDTVAAFQEDGHVMTDAEAAALRDSQQSRSSIKGRPLPSRKQKSTDRE